MEKPCCQRLSKGSRRVTSSPKLHIWPCPFNCNGRCRREVGNAGNKSLCGCNYTVQTLGERFSSWWPQCWILKHSDQPLVLCVFCFVCLTTQRLDAIIICCFCFSSTVVQKLHTNVTGKDGDTVPLPCSTENKTNISRDIIQWYKGPKTKENKPIHKYVPRDRPPQTPRDDFINLTSLSEKGLLSGDCSLNLTVNTSHNDTYYCYVAGRLLCTVTLKGTY